MEKGVLGWDCAHYGEYQHNMGRELREDTHAYTVEELERAILEIIENLKSRNNQETYEEVSDAIYGNDNNEYGNDEYYDDED